MDKSKEYVEKSPAILVGVRAWVSETYAGLSIEAFITPYGGGARIALVQKAKNGIYPVATACARELQAPIKDIVHGLCGLLKVRAKEEVQHLRKESRSKK